MMSDDMEDEDGWDVDVVEEMKRKRRGSKQTRGEGSYLYTNKQTKVWASLSWGGRKGVG